MAAPTLSQLCTLETAPNGQAKCVDAQAWPQQEGAGAHANAECADPRLRPPLENDCSRPAMLRRQWDAAEGRIHVHFPQGWRLARVLLEISLALR